jgi:hypothetical protein
VPVVPAPHARQILLLAAATEVEEVKEEMKRRGMEQPGG